MRKYAFFVSGSAIIMALSCSANAPEPSGSGAAPGTGTTGTGSGTTGTGGTTGTSTGSTGTTGTTGSGGTINVTVGAGGTGTGSGGTGGNSAMTCDGKMKAVIRDFTPQHLDFEVAATAPDFVAMYGARAAGKTFMSDKGIVAPTLGPDLSPVYAANPTTGSPTTTGQTNFDQWFHDTPGVNMSTIYEMQFVDPEGDGVFTFDNGGMPFFPIDGQLLGNYPLYNNLHNWHMTLELHSKFIYTPGMVFTFYGDDDVWVFINNTLVVDLGGVHQKETGQVALDTLGLTAGQEYQLDFFWAERHIVDSNFKIDTSIAFVDCGIVVVK